MGLPFPQPKQEQEEMITGVLPFSDIITHLGKTQPLEAKEKTFPARRVCTGFLGG